MKKNIFLFVWLATTIDTHFQPKDILWKIHATSLAEVSPASEPCEGPSVQSEGNPKTVENTTPLCGAGLNPSVSERAAFPVARSLLAHSFSPYQGDAPWCSETR